MEDNSTMVNLLTNTENADKISVKIQHGSTTIYGIIVGYDKENEVLKISQLNSSGDISAGDKVTTGGLGNFNVADIPVGEVVATTHSTDYLTREVTVKLSADTHNVSVIELVGNHNETAEAGWSVLLLPFFVLIDAHISQLLGSFFPPCTVKPTTIASI